MAFAAKKSASASLSAVLVLLSPGTHCWASAAGIAKAGRVKTGPAFIVPGPAAAPSGLGFPSRLPAVFSPAGSLGAGPAPLPWSSGGNEALFPPAGPPDLTVPMRAGPAPILPAQAVADAISGAGQDIAPMLEDLGQDKAPASESSREIGEGIFQRLLGLRFRAAQASSEPAAPSRPASPSKVPSSLSPKIKVTPVSEHLPGVFFIKFRANTTLEVMLGILARDGVEPELYADNGNGFRVRVALPDIQAAQVVMRLAGVGQVEEVEVNRKVYTLLREDSPPVSVPSIPASHATKGLGAERLHDANRDRGELLGGAAGVLLALGVGAFAYFFAPAGFSLPEALFWSSVSALGTGMLTTLTIAALGWEIGDRMGREKVDRIHREFLDLHRSRILAVRGVSGVRHQRGIPGLTDAVTPADGPLFVVTLDKTVPYETVRQRLKASVPELDGSPVFFE